MNFETPSQSPRPSSPEKEKQSDKKIETLSNAEKVIAALVSGAALATTAPLAIERYRIDHPEYIRENVLDLGKEMNELFGTKLQVESQNGQYILHIAQNHGKENDSPAARAEVVRYQKDAEKLILELQKRYGINVYFHEGRTIEWRELSERSPYQNTLESALNQYQEDGHEFYMRYKLLDGLKPIEELIRTFNPDLRNTAEHRRHDAEAYFVLRKDKQLLKYLLSSQEILRLPERVQDCQRALERVNQLLHLAETTPGFTDQVYLIMGATEKLAREEKIIELPAETIGSHSNRPKAKLQTFGAARDFHERREDVSTSLGLEYMYKTSSTYVPIVYGAAHDFSDSVKRLNSVQADPAYKIGLIRVEYKSLGK